MGEKDKYFNRISNGKPKRPTQHDIKREILIQKVHHIDRHVDIKVYVTEEEHAYLNQQAKFKQSSVTKICTNALKKVTSEYREFPEFEYEKSAYMVHFSVPRACYNQIVGHSVNWKCSIREATQRVFNYGYELGLL